MLGTLLFFNLLPPELYQAGNISTYRAEIKLTQPKLESVAKVAFDLRLGTRLVVFVLFCFVFLTI